MASLVLAGAGGPMTPASESLFGGCIVYETEYQTMVGAPLFYAVKPKSWLYIQGNSFKAYDRKKQLEELYLGDKNELYRFDKGQAVLVPDTARPPAHSARTCLLTTATILGYRCQLLQLVQGGVSTLVFYSPQLRIEAEGYRHCPAPGWYELLQATDGALPLRVISVDIQHDITVTREAIEVRALPLAAADFTPVAPAR
ncbi:hypothetical protein [Hymenobacter cheonanensis]|uniref:hypothetical protein n=1 Tax=Hymenobacter sp. CA2-7 TaxID=3063993 RepID=UPI002712DE4E|nr:hypothetical protein [Hymenobacter sp. CA2-7]MDO7886971.1 hypothetical protein [Hymenobacter sp. CA2-7]